MKNINKNKYFIETLEEIIRGIKEGKLEPVHKSESGQIEVSTMETLIDVEHTFGFKYINLEKRKEEQKEKSLNTLINYINYDLHDIFRDAIIGDKEFRISSSTLRRGIGKTSTLAYLAIRYDLKLIVNNMFTARQLKEDFPTLEVYAKEKAFNTDGLFSPGELVLVDELNGSSSIRFTKF